MAWHFARSYTDSIPNWCRYSKWLHLTLSLDVSLFLDLLLSFSVPLCFYPGEQQKVVYGWDSRRKSTQITVFFFEIENKGFTQGKGSWGFLPHRGKFSVITILKCHYPQYLLQWLISDILWETKTMTQWYFKWRQRRFVKTAVTCNWNFCFFQHLFIICARYVMRTRHVTSRETF